MQFLKRRLIYGIVRFSSTNHVSRDLKVYNSISKKNEHLNLKHGNTLLWYSCGPTVYDSAHIGHASSYVSLDIIKRILHNYFHINVSDVLNITDVDDKIIAKASQTNKTITEVATFYEKEFFEDMALLNCTRPLIVLRVTQHIAQIIEFIQKLERNGQAYRAKSGSVYFRTQKFAVKSFFEMNEEIGLENDGDESEKEHVFDFALWKAKKVDSEASWASPWGDGRPGWHIECSTLAEIAFGAHLDLHSGGKDLIFPHHHNEMTQCCAYHDTDHWASHWLHTGHLHLSGQTKMSKSLKNTVSVRELLAKFSCNQFRFFCLLNKFRNDIEFSEEKMLKPVKLLHSLQTFLNLARTYCNEEVPMLKANIDEDLVYAKLSEVQANVHRALCDDFNTSLVIEELFQLISIVNKGFKQPLDDLSNNGKEKSGSSMSRHYGCVMGVANYVGSTFKVMGIELDRVNLMPGQGKFDASDLVDGALKFRRSVRELALSKDLKVSKEIKEILLKACDQFREDFKEQKIEFKDIKGETIWQLKE